MDYKIADFKFLLPPIILILFVVLGIQLFGSEKQIASFQLYFQSHNSLITAIGVLLLILTLGVLISGIGYAFLSLLVEAPYPKWNNRAEKKLKNLFNHWPEPDGKFSQTAKGEVAEWFLHKKFRKIVSDKMQKRWEMTLLNLNICIAILISITVILIIIFSWASLCFLLALASIIIFGYNFYKGRKSIHDINHILLNEYIKKIRPTKMTSQELKTKYLEFFKSI